MNVRGNLPDGGIAIIGSRTPPKDAEAFAYELAKRVNEPVIAGLAPGIDTAAHRGALAAGTPTVAFVAYGFGASDNPELEREIVDAGGGIATVREPNAAVTEEAKIERDRLQAEHARAVVLVCSEIDGGAMHAMRFARELEKPRFAVMPPRNASSDLYWSGNTAALLEGATPLPLKVDEALRRLHELGHIR
jgi:DNA processing protein